MKGRCRQERYGWAGTGACCLVYDVYACVCGLEGRGICDVLCYANLVDICLFNGMHVSILMYPTCFISETKGNFHGDMTNKVYSILMLRLIPVLLTTVVPELLRV